MSILRNVTPKNYGRAKYAQEELDWTISRANAQLSEAMKVDGVKLNYWKRTDEGQFCTCGYGLNQLNNSKIGNILINDNQIKIAPDKPNTMGDEGNSTVLVRGAWDEEKGKKSKSPSKVLGVDLANNALKDDFKDLRSQYSNVAQVTGEEEAFFSAPFGYDLISGMERTQCGICLGTGKTNPYSLIGGKRDIFDSFSVVGLNKFFADTSTRPYSYKAPQDSSAYVQYVYTLPIYFKQCMNIAVRNNTKAVRDLAVFYQIAGSNSSWQLLSTSFLNSRQNTSTVLNLRVMPITNSFNDTIKFTHLEIIWQYSEFPLSQVGAMSVAANNQIRETVMAATFTLPPSIESVTKNDIFYDYKYNNMWTVTDFTDNQTANKFVLSWQVSSRKMQAYEQRSLLRLINERFYEISYSGLDGLSSQLVREEI